MAIFNITNNMTQVTEVVSLADTFTGGMLGVLIYIVIGFGSLFLTSSFSMKESLVVSSFILMVTSFFLKYLNLLSDFFLWLSAFFFIVAIIISFTKGGLGVGV